MFQYQDFEASGNPILIQNETTALPPPIINELHIYGGSYQNKLTGSQLLNPSLFEEDKTVFGITYTKQQDGSIIIDGKVEEGKSSTFQLGDYIDILEDGKKYVFNSGSAAGVLNIGYSDGTPNDYQNTVVVDKKRMAYIKCYIQFNKQYPPKTTHLFPMLNEGTVIKPFEPYTGGKTSPSIEIPAEIINKGKNGSIKVEVTGKNLWDNEAAMSLDHWLGTNVYKHFDLNLKPNTTYTLSVNQNNMYKGYKSKYDGYFAFYLGETEGAASPNVLFGNSNSSIDLRKTYHTFTTSDKPFYINLYMGDFNEANLKIAFTELLQNIMFAEGASVLLYEPYHVPQSLTLATPNGLPGVPVTKDGNYTDQNGQQWVCDEVDLGRGKYVQRVGKYVFDGTEAASNTWLPTIIVNMRTDGLTGKHGTGQLMSNYAAINFSNITGRAFGFATTKWNVNNAEELKSLLKNKSDSGIPVVAQYVLTTPIERDLTPEELAAYKSIVTHNDTTVVSNNENCNMKIKYTKGVIMPKYDSTKLIVQMKALARTESMPIDSTEVWDSLAEAQSYIKEANAYAGQTIKALVNGKYKTYTLQPSGGGYTLEEVGAVSQSDLKQYVQVVEQLPSSGQQQGVIYIVGTTGQIWTGSAWKVVFKEVSTQVDQLTTKVTQLEGEINKKAPINNPVFTGKVMVGSDEVAVKSYVDGLISNLVSSAPGVVDGDHLLPADGYKAGQTWRVALAGTYAGQKCEVGDLIICIKDFNTQTNNSDFMVVQANVDGAVTSTATTSTVGEIVVFNAATGKVIKGSGVNISSLNDAISKAHTHTNKAILDTYNKNQTQLLADAATTAQGKVDALKVEVDKKANKATTLAGYGITDAYTEAEIDAKLKTITDNVNTKVDAATVDSKINTAKGEIETAYNLAITEKLAARVGSIPEDTDIKTYVDTAVGSGGTASAEAIAKAKQEAINASKAYTDSQLQVTEF